MGLIATMTALVLGLQLGSAKSSFDTQKSEVTDISAKIILLDRTLAHYGPDTRAVRDLLRSSVEDKLERVWPQDPAPRSTLQPTPLGNEDIYEKVQELLPTTDVQRAAKARALSILFDIGQTRWLMIEQESNSASMPPLLFVMAFWLTITFISFGLFAPRNATVIITVSVCAMSVSAAIFLILELYSPFNGVIRIPSEPLRNALVQLGQ
jgi:hypothetical protein